MAYLCSIKACSPTDEYMQIRNKTLRDIQHFLTHRVCKCRICRNVIIEKTKELRFLWSGAKTAIAACPKALTVTAADLLAVAQS